METRSWELTANATLRLPRSAGAMVVRVDRGTVLVTQEGDRADHVLEAGDELVLRRTGVAVAWAFTDAGLRIREAARTRHAGVAAARDPLRGAA